MSEIAQAKPPFPGGHLWQEVVDRHSVWAWTSFYFLVLTAAFAFATLIDDRLFNGVNVWIKPMKFSLSLWAYFVTLAWFAPLVERGFFDTGLGRAITWTTILCAVFEIFYIALQAGRGEASHFNETSPMYSVLYGLMGVGAVTLVLACAVLGAKVLRRHGSSDSYAFAVGLGLILTFVLGGGFGGYLSSNGGHWVGGTMNDSQGLWLFRWSRDGGDLRVAHFFGIHAMQFVPLIGFAVRKMAPEQGRVWVIASAVLLSAFVTATFWQAVQGRPFLG